MAGDTVYLDNGNYSCTTKELKDKSGLKIICNGDSIGVVLNGVNGKDGEKGDPGVAGRMGKRANRGFRVKKGILVPPAKMVKMEPMARTELTVRMEPTAKTVLAVQLSSRRILLPLSSVAILR
jgi:hypothetical protein